MFQKFKGQLSMRFFFFKKNIFYDFIFYYYCIFYLLLQIDGETVETVSDFIFLGSKITADGDGSHEIKIHLLLGRKV